MQDNPRDFDYEHEQFCEKCNSRQMGTEYHANDAMGMATPVLWNCHRCANPPAHVALYRAAERMVTRARNKINWWLLPAEEKRKRRDHRAKVIAPRSSRASTSAGPRKADPC